MRAYGGGAAKSCHVVTGPASEHPAGDPRSAGGGTARRDSSDMSDTDSEKSGIAHVKSSTLASVPPQLPGLTSVRVSTDESKSIESPEFSLRPSEVEEVARHSQGPSDTPTTDQPIVVAHSGGAASWSGRVCDPSAALGAAVQCRRPGPGASEEFTWDEVKKHRYRDSCWLVANGIVYDVTPFLDLHPVGADAILRRAGRDNTEDLDFHSRGA